MTITTKAPVGVLTVLLSLFLLIAAPLHARADDVEDAKTQVHAVVEDAVSSFAGKAIPWPERVAKLHEMIAKYGDLRICSQDILGRYWTKATPEQQDDFTKLVVDYVIGSWSGQIGQLSATFHVDITSAEALPDGHVVVHSTSLSQTTLPVDWFLIRSPDGRMVFSDVNVEGISIIQTLRSDFTGIIRANGGKLESLLEALRSKISSYENKS